MKNAGSIIALVAALVLVCGVVALEWYNHIGRQGTAAPTPVQAITGAPSAAPVAQATKPPRPLVYVPVQSTPAVHPASSIPPAPSPVSSGAPQTVSPSAAPQTPPPLNAGATPLPEAPAATLAPTTIMPPVIREGPNAPPRILAMSLSSPVARGGDVVLGTVETSSNVASVEARIGGYAASMQKVGVGRFHLAYRVPNLPFFLHRTYTIQIIARNSNGDAVTSSLPITVR